MNPINKNYAYLWDMLEACKKIQKFSQDISEKDYVKDILRQSAVERQLEILGEAARRISVDIFLGVILLVKETLLLINMKNKKEFG